MTQKSIHHCQHLYTPDDEQFLSTITHRLCRFSSLSVPFLTWGWKSWYRKKLEGLTFIWITGRGLPSWRYTNALHMPTAILYRFFHSNTSSPAHEWKEKKSSVKRYRFQLWGCSIHLMTSFKLFEHCSRRWEEFLHQVLVPWRWSSKVPSGKKS